MKSVLRQSMVLALEPFVHPFQISQRTKLTAVSESVARFSLYCGKSNEICYV